MPLIIHGRPIKGPRQQASVMRGGICDIHPQRVLVLPWLHQDLANPRVAHVQSPSILLNHCHVISSEKRLNPIAEISICTYEPSLQTWNKNNPLHSRSTPVPDGSVSYQRSPPLIHHLLGSCRYGGSSDRYAVAAANASQQLT